MRIDLTPEQGRELDNSFWSIDYTVRFTHEDGSVEEWDANTADDDPRDIPLTLVVGQLAVITDDRDRVTGYACAHPDLTPDDAVLIKYVLDERAALMAPIYAAPQDQRAALRTTLRQAIRTQARQDARKAKRQEIRRRDRIAARAMMRADLETDAAAKLAADRANRSVEDTP